jgi:ubiquinone/menaquinone biosynthesis C-methylase UbiE
MEKKVLFPIDLSESNQYKRDYLINKISKYLNLSKSSLIEIGIGNGRFGFLLGDRVIHYYGIDIDDEYVKIAKTNIPKDATITYKIGNAESIPFENKFDILLYANSWHFIKDFDKALKEAERVLKSDGIIIILEPSEKTKNWGSPKLRKDSLEFNKKMYENKLKDLEKGKKAIFDQNLFDVIEQEYDSKTTSNLFILKRKYFNSFSKR